MDTCKLRKNRQNLLCTHEENNSGNQPVMHQPVTMEADTGSSVNNQQFNL